MTERGVGMDQQQRTARFGIYVILCACILRLGISGMPEALAERLEGFSGQSLEIETETGQDVRFSASLEAFSSYFRESPPPWIPTKTALRFGAEDLALVEMDYDCDLRPDLEALMEKPLDWDLTGEEPTVLILHTHTTESYTKGSEAYTETSRYRTLEAAYNMLSIGDAVAQQLTRKGITVIHDREVHDYPSYNGAYVHARSALEEILEQNPSIRLVLDLHRDALETAEGKQLRTLAEANGKPAAQLMLVVGTDVSRPSHENWQENLALALKLHIQLERLCPGIMRPLNLRAQRFNQDLSAGALLVEVGAAGNTREEALAAAELLAEAVAQLAEGTQ